MAAEGIGYDEIVAATHICRNKSSLATILATPIYRGVKVFNRETRVEGEHWRKRRRTGADEVVTSEVDPIVPEPLWTRMQELLVRRREHRLAPQRYAGGYLFEPTTRRLTAAGLPPAFVLRIGHGRPIESQSESHMQPGWYRIPDSQ